MRKTLFSGIAACLFATAATAAEQSPSVIWTVGQADRSACPTVHITEGDCSAAVAAVAKRHAAIPENNVFLMVWVCWLIKCSYNFGVK